jgi:hypothetical protein
MDREKRLLACETAGSIAWFAMDASWMLALPVPAAALAVPTVLLNLLIFRWTVRTWPNLLVTAAMAAWACMNVLWMCADLKLVAGGLPVAKGFCVAGGIFLAAALIGATRWTDALEALLRRFRRLRLRIREK